MENLPVKRTRLVKWLAIWGVWTLFGLFFTTQLALQSQLWKTPYRSGKYCRGSSVSGYVWFALSPLILFLTNRFPFEAGRWKISLPVHLVAAVVVALFQQSIDAFLLTRLGYPPDVSSQALAKLTSILFTLTCISAS
jgi:hypothetical protein